MVKKNQKKRHHNGKKLPLLLAELFLVCMMVFPTIALIQNNPGSEDLNRRFSPEPSAAVAHVPISITGNDVLDSFCSGNGTDGLSWATAHVIENYEILTAGEMGAVYLNATTRYLIIKDMDFRSGPSTFSAIRLQNVTNIRIVNIDTNKWAYSIYIRESNNVTISDSLFTETGRGIDIADSEDIYISTCTFYFDGSGTLMLYPFNIANSINITVDYCLFDNLAETSSKTPTNFVSGTTGFSLVNSTVQDSHCRFLSTTSGNNTYICNNTILDSTDYGVRMYGERNFTVSNNNFDTGDQDALYLYECHNGTILNNQFNSSGIELYASVFSSNLTIPDSNLVNGKKIIYYEQMSQINEELGDIGQLILNGVNSSTFSNAHIMEGGHGVQCFKTNNVTFVDMNITNTQGYGFMGNDNNNLTFCNVTVNSPSYGLYLKFGTNTNISNCTIISGGTGVYLTFDEKAVINSNSFDCGGNGISLGNIQEVELKNNQFFGCSFEISSSVENTSLDTSNLKDGNPIYYLEDHHNDFLDIGMAGEFVLIKCSNLVISNLILENSTLGIQLNDCVNIQFRNITVNNAEEYGLYFQTCNNVSVLNSSFTNCDYGLEFYNCNNTLFQQNFLNNTGELGYIEECINTTFIENGFFYFDDSLYVEDANYISISNNQFGSNTSDLYVFDDSMNVTIDQNVENAEYDRSVYTPLQFSDDPFGIKVTPETPTGGDDDDDDGDDDSSGEGDTNTDTESNTDTNSETTTDPNNDDPSSNIWVPIVIIASVVALIGGAMLFLVKTGKIKIGSNETPK